MVINMANKKSLKRKSNRSKERKKIENINSGVEKDVFKILWIIFGVLLFLAIFYLITVAIVSDDSEDESSDETVIQYDEILAGSSFNMRGSEYLVIYYDSTDDDLTELTNAVYNYTYYGTLRLYSVDMNDGFNKKYATDEESNKEPTSASELAINGPTLIKISDGNCIEYIEGNESIIDYLS